MTPGNYGREIRRADIGGFVCTESLRPPRSSIRPHAHPYTNVALVLEGTFFETVGTRVHELRPGSVILRPAGETHENRYPNGGRCLIVEIKPERLAALRELAPVLDSSLHLRGAPLPAIAARFNRELRAVDRATPLVLESLLLEILAFAMRDGLGSARPAVPSWLEVARDLLEERFSHPLSLSGIAAEVGVHPAHLARMFRRHYRCTAGEFVRRVRLERSARDVVGSDRPLADIALANGFFDQSHFTRAFKLHFGRTPSSVRRAAGGLSNSARSARGDSEPRP
jgi:AraC family transcriptional regulator